MDNDLFKLLVCPRDRYCLEKQGFYLICKRGHKYPIVNDIPVLLLSEITPTLWVAQKSWELGNRSAESSNLTDNYFIETLGLSDTERKYLEEVIEKEPSWEKVLAIIVSTLLGATCGLKYKNTQCDLTRLPVPNLTFSNQGSLFLDVGCNWGRWPLAALKHGYKVFGLDPSLGSLVVAKEVFKYFGYRGNFICGDARYLPFASGSFDVVFSYSVFQHFSKENACAAFKEISRVLKKNGVSYIQMANSFGVCSFFNQLRRRFKRPSDFDVRYWSPFELKKTFNQLIGVSSIYIDSFFGLGNTDIDSSFHSPKVRLVLFISRVLKFFGKCFPFINYLADSLFVRSVKHKDN